MKIKTLLSIGLACIQLNIFAQITFQKSFDFYFEDQLGYAVKQTFDDGYILTGFTDPNNALVIKTNAFGDTLWTRSYRDIGMCGFDVVQTADSNFVICGYQYPSTPYVFLLKIDGNGNTLWSSQPCAGWGQAIQETYDRNFIIAGKRLTKTDSQGSILWCKDLDFQAMYVIQSADSNYILSGFRISGDTICLQKTDQDGTILWTKCYAGHYSNTSNNILAQTVDGGYIISGGKYTTEGGLLLIKTDANGDTLWTKTWLRMIARSVVQTRDGGYVIGGTDYTTHPCRLMILKTDADGNIVWRQGYFTNSICGGNESNHGKSIRETEDGGFIFTGVVHNTPNSTSANYDAVLIKTDSMGNILPTSIHTDNQINEISVYPNPFSSSTTIHFTADITGADLTMYNLYGQTVWSMTHIFSNKIEINREQLPAGLYFIIITQDHKVIATEKVAIGD